MKRGRLTARHARRAWLVAASSIVIAIGVGACGQDDDPEGAQALWEKFTSASFETNWRRAPGYATRKPSFTAHGREVEIFVSPEIQAAFDKSNAPSITTWPLGSIIVKESFSGDTRTAVAAMEKRADGWFWAEYDDSGKSKYSGHPSICTDCHGHRETYSDWVYAFELPR